MNVRAALVGAALVAALAGCGGDEGEPASEPGLLTLGLFSSAFVEDASIPRMYTCDGEDVSPPLSWTRVPARARALALTVEDRDVSGGAFLHWSIYDMPRGSASMNSARLPPGSLQGTNSLGKRGYSGPCPPKGDEAHRYVFRIHALDAQLGLPAGASPDAVRRSIEAHSLTSGSLTGRYRR